MRTQFTYLLFLVLIWPVSALASDDCATAQTSADVMRCVNQNHERAEASLNDAYKNLSMKKTGEPLEGMESLQKLWIEYRDRECGAETAPLASESLKRLEGLKCKTRLTLARIDALQKTLAAETGASMPGEPPTTQQPRWINALSEEHQDVYWHYGGYTNGDLDCDDEGEFVIAGLMYDGETAEHKSVIAVSENPSTGKPTSILLSLPEHVAAEGEEAGPSRCSSLLDFSFDVLSEEGEEIEQEIKEEQGEEEMVESAEAVDAEDTSCNRRLIITRKANDKTAVCRPVIVYWDGQNYAVEQ